MPEPTPTPCVATGYLGLVEQPDTGQLQVTDRILMTAHWKASLLTCLAGIQPRGTYASSITILGVNYGPGRVESCSVEPEPDTTSAHLRIVWLLLMGSLPLQESNFSPVENNISIEKNPFFTGILDSTIHKVETALRAPSDADRVNAEKEINGLKVEGGYNQKTLGLALLSKRQRGQDSYYFAAGKYSIVSFAYTLPGAPSGGGFLDIPVVRGGDILPGGWSWLRQADEFSWQNGVYRMTTCWIGAGAGFWDTDIYP